LTRIARHPDLVVWWGSAGPVVRNLESGVTLTGDAETLAIVSAFDRPREARAVARELPACDAREITSRIRLLRRLGLLIPEDAARKRRPRIGAWKGNVATALYHSASRDLRYLAGPAADRLARLRVLPHARPALFKRYGVAPRKNLPAGPTSGVELEAALAARRTIRKFRREPVPLSDLAAIVGGTWRRTGTHSGGLFGSLMRKTSPSAGSLHPVECYVLAWNVRDLRPGLYHYDAGADELRRLRTGHPRAEAVRAASGQTWVGGAAFLCIMTAVFARSLWKYQDELAYRTLFLDAGHLAQTFCLLATARGLGPFTTAALQDSYVERIIGLDGVSEFPIYLCGAGVPAQRG
jgi:SagB-type dehydrogenase family enzyme